MNLFKVVNKTVNKNTLAKIISLEIKDTEILSLMNM